MKRVNYVTNKEFLYYWSTPIAIPLCGLVTIDHHLTVIRTNSSYQTMGFILDLDPILIGKALSFGTVCSPHRQPQIQIPIVRSTRYSLPDSRGFLPRVL